MPHSIPSATHKINTIAGEQHSHFKRENVAALLKRGDVLDLHQEQAEAVLWPFLCDHTGTEQGFPRMKCHRASTDQEMCPCKRTAGICCWHHRSLQYGSPHFGM